MAPEQLAVFALVVAGFVAGWVARGASGRGEELVDARAALEALLAAVAAASAAPTGEALEAVGRARAALDEADEALELARGSDDSTYATFDQAANIAVRAAQDLPEAGR